MKEADKQTGQSITAILKAARGGEVNATEELFTARFPKFGEGNYEPIAHESFGTI